MSDKEIDEQIAEAIEELEQDENEQNSVHSGEEAQISQSIMAKVDWKKFPTDRKSTRLNSSH